MPFNPDSDLNLRLESHGDALGMLTLLAGDSLAVKRGSTNLRLLLRGPMNQPQANGFVVVSNGDLSIGEQELSRINASILFDFDRVLVQRLEAEVAAAACCAVQEALACSPPRAGLHRSPCKSPKVRFVSQSCSYRPMANCRFLVPWRNQSSREIWNCREARFGPSQDLSDVPGGWDLKDWP